MRSRGPASTKRFFAEYERLVLRGAGVDVDAGRAWEVWENVRQQRYEMTRFNDVLPVFDLLKQQGLTLGMISNMNRPAGELAASMGLAPYLDFCRHLGRGWSREAASRHLPDGLGTRRSEPQETVHVGDQLMSDVDGASAVGISPVLLDRDDNHPGYDGCPASPANGTARPRRPDVSQGTSSRFALSLSEGHAVSPSKRSLGFKGLRVPLRPRDPRASACSKEAVSL